MTIVVMIVIAGQFEAPLLSGLYALMFWETVLVDILVPLTQPVHVAPRLAPCDTQWLGHARRCADLVRRRATPHQPGAGRG
jgi:hypothetical protein